MAPGLSSTSSSPPWGTGSKYPAAKQPIPKNFSWTPFSISLNSLGFACGGERGKGLSLAGPLWTTPEKSCWAGGGSPQGVRVSAPVTLCLSHRFLSKRQRLQEESHLMFSDTHKTRPLSTKEAGKERLSVSIYVSKLKRKPVAKSKLTVQENSPPVFI